MQKITCVNEWLSIPEVILVDHHVQNRHGYISQTSCCQNKRQRPSKIFQIFEIFQDKVHIASRCTSHIFLLMGRTPSFNVNPHNPAARAPVTNAQINHRQTMLFHSLYINIMRPACKTQQSNIFML